MNRIVAGALTCLALATCATPLYAQAPTEAPAPKTQAGVIPLLDFVKNAEAAEMQISPTGNYLALTVPLEEGGTVLYVIDRASMKLSATVRGGNHSVIDRFWWVNDTRLVASVAEQLGGVAQPQPNGELYAVNADGSGSMQLFGYRGAEQAGSHIKHGGEKRQAGANVIGLLPEDRKHILIQTYEWQDSKNAPPGVEVLDVYSGNTRRVGVGPKGGLRFVADHHGEVRVALASDDELYSKLYMRADNKADWKIYNDQKTSNEVITPLMFARDNHHLYIAVSRPKMANALYRLDLDKNTRELLYSGNADPGQLLLTPDEQDAYGVMTHDGKTGIHVFDPKSADGRLALSLQKAFPNDVAVFLNFANDGKTGLVHVFSDRNAGDFYLFDTAKMGADYIYSARKWLEPEQMAAMQPISFKARDGLELHGYLTLPPGSDGKNLPLIVNPHGGPHDVRDYWGFDPEVQLLASRGYAVLQLNFRGSDGYGIDFQQAGYRQWGLTMQDDLTDATNWAVKQGYADSKRMCIYGASYGGYAALEGVIREPDLYRCAIGYVGVYDLSLMYKDGDIPKSLFGKQYLQMIIGSDSAEMQKRSPVGGVSRIKSALMLVAGGRDERVPISQANALRKALDDRDYPYRWMLKDTEGHGYYLTNNKMELYTEMLDFLGKNITATPAAPAVSASH